MLIKDICKIINGATPSTSCTEYWDGDIAWLTPKDLSGYSKRYISCGERSITQQGYNSCSTTLVPKNAILLTSRAPIGYLAIAEKEVCTNQGFKSIICDKNKVIPLYLFYWLQTRVDYLKSISNGVTFKELSKDTFENVKIELPDMSTQQHIVDTIGSVDDLIEKYEKIVFILHGYLDKKYLQLISEKPTTKISNLDYFQICKSGIKRFEGNKIYLDTASVEHTNIVDESNLISFDNRPLRANMQPCKNTVWFAKLKDSPKYILIKPNSKDIIRNFIFSTGFLGLQSEPYLVNYIYCLILSNDFNRQKDLLSNGATMQGINNETFNEIIVPDISQSDAISFGKTIEDCVNLIIELKNKNHYLKQLKNQLLQKCFG